MSKFLDTVNDAKNIAIVSNLLSSFFKAAIVCLAISFYIFSKVSLAILGLIVALFGSADKVNSRRR